MNTISAEIRAYIKLITNIEIENLYYDWSLENQSGVFLGVGPSPYVIKDSYQGKNEVHEAVIRMSGKVEKEPSSIQSTRINSRTLIAVRDEILVEIEKQLIRDGLEDALRNAKGKLEKSMLNMDHINSHIDGEVVELFIDWDFDIDRSFLIMILNPKS
ncbi:Na-translocating system protein MpsC family protein [Pseudalkalibacillus sp. A8]|uniref:Na-translocating system protein MpsC family protein n=1 Tax=Pseudalkalibacillus sp. A8 TaxID=3382641 RepID=UPI0038B47B8B